MFPGRVCTQCVYIPLIILFKMSLQLCFRPGRIVKSMKENENTDYSEASLLHQMDTEKFPSVPTHLTLHHMIVLLLFKVKVNFKLRATMFEMTDIIVLVSVIF